MRPVLLICKLVVQFKVNFVWLSCALIRVFTVALCLGLSVNHPMPTQTVKVNIEGSGEVGSSKKSF